MASRIPFGLLCLILGVGVGFLSLETAGLVWLLLAPVATIALRRRGNQVLATSLVGCGAGCIVAVVFFAIETSGVLSGGSDQWPEAYFGSQLGVGLAVMVVGIVLYHRGRSASAA